MSKHPTKSYTGLHVSYFQNRSRIVGSSGILLVIVTNNNCTSLQQCNKLSYCHQDLAGCLKYPTCHILAVICAEHIYLRSKTNRGLRQEPDVNSHRVALVHIMRAGPNKGMRYRPDVCVSLREYGRHQPCEIFWVLPQTGSHLV